MAKTKKEISRGGARKGSGRKPVADKRIGVTLYIKESIIESFGGIEGIRDFLYKLIPGKSNDHS